MITQCRKEGDLSLLDSYPLKTLLHLSQFLARKVTMASFVVASPYLVVVVLEEGKEEYTSVKEGDLYW